MGYRDPNEMQNLEAQQQANQQQAGLASQTGPQLAALLTGWQRTYPFMSPAVILPLAQSGMDPASEEAKKVAGAEVIRQNSSKFSGGLNLGPVGSIIKAGGSAVKAAGSAVTPDFVGESLNSDIVKTGVRYTTMALDAGGQTLQGEFRNAASDGFGWDDLSPSNLISRSRDAFIQQSDLGQAIGQGLRKDMDVDTGSGFFAGGNVRKDALEARRNAAPLIDGHALSLGRWAGQKVFEPGSKPYNLLSGLVDGGVLLASDPSSYVGVGETRRATDLTIDASRKFVDSGRKIEVTAPAVRQAAPAVDSIHPYVGAGLLDNGVRKTILPERAAEWLLSKPGQKVVDHLADTTDFNELRRTFKKSIDTETLVKLADSRSRDEVYDILGPKLGVDIRTAPTMPGRLPMTVSKRLDSVRMAGMMPGRHVDLRDADESVEQLDRFMRNGKMSPETRAKRIDQMARATNRNERFDILKKSMSDLQTQLGDVHLVSASLSNKLTRLWSDYDPEYAKYAVDELGKNMEIPGVGINGIGEALPGPHLQSEYLNRAVPLPDARLIRAATSRYAAVLAAPGAGESIAVLDFVTQQMFKPLVLIRGAWTVRVVGEEQIRMGSSGLSSAFVHPLSHLAIVLSTESKVGRAAERAGVQVGRMSTDLTGAPLMEAQSAIDALSKGTAGFRDALGEQAGRMINTNRKTLIERGLPGYERAWLDELSDLHHDPVATRVALGGLRAGDGNIGDLQGMDAIKEWFWSGAGKAGREDMAASSSILRGRAGADAYVDSIVKRVNAKTGTDADLVDIVAHGKFNGEQLFSLTGAATRQQGKADKALMKELQRRAQDVNYTSAPSKVKADLRVQALDSPANKVFDSYDKAVNSMFNILMSRPTNFLSRSPAFKQFYWQRSTELVRHMDPEAQRAAINAAVAAKLPKDTIAKMRLDARRYRGELNIEDADILAKGHGLDSTRKLLYDLHDRSQFFDITRVLFPFGEAWKEVALTWAKIGRENPVVARRATQLVQGGRNADVDGDGQGIFYPDEQTGQEMVAIPFSKEFNKLATGVPVGLAGPVQSLNIFGSSVLPGFGPVVQIAAGKLLPDDPAYDKIRNAVIPYGETDMSGGFVESFLPAWFKKWETAGGGQGIKQQRQFANTTTDVMRYLLSTGDYSIDTPENQAKLLKDSREKASRLFFLRGMAQFVSPTPPSPQFIAKDKNGDTLFAFQMADEYRKLQEQDYKTATSKFIDKFGENAFLVTIGKTEGGGPVSTAGLDFERDHPDVAKAYPDIFGFFVKQDGTDDFSQTAYQRQLDSGRRTLRPPEDAIELANQRIATSIYQQAKAKVGDRPNAVQRQALRDVQDELKQRYPGYNAQPNNLGATDDLIQSVISASKNPVLSKTEVGGALTTYIKARDMALEQARAADLSGFTTSDKAAPLRQWLRSVGEALAVRHPEFAPLFDQALSRELGDPAPPVTAGGN